MVKLTGATFLGLRDRRVRELRHVDDGDRAGADDREDAIRIDERRGVLVQADADRERIVRERGEQTSEAIALAKMLIDHDAVGESEARDQA